MIEKTYYWESAGDCGDFPAVSAAEARRKLHCLDLVDPCILYRENDSADGLPFIIVWEKD
ncbi:MAG: hypothetical protein ACYSUB_02040 [Planctomycetota bacterium]|jgi:hypothetical protein